MLNAQKIIDIFGLKPLCNEGGFYAETYRSENLISKSLLPKSYDSDRCLNTAIYYLLTPNTHSAIHRLPSNEIYHFYLGDTVEILLLSPDGEGKIIRLGHDIINGEQVQVIVPNGTWQGSYLLEGGKFALMGTTMAPGFDFKDYESAPIKKLKKIYPRFEDIINRLSHH